MGLAVDITGGSPTSSTAPWKHCLDGEALQYHLFCHQSGFLVSHQHTGLKEKERNRGGKESGEWAKRKCLEQKQSPNYISSWSTQPKLTLKQSGSRNASQCYWIAPLPSGLFSFLSTCVVASTLTDYSQPGKTPPKSFSRASVPSWRLPRCFNCIGLNFNGRGRSSAFSRTNNSAIL